MKMLQAVRGMNDVLPQEMQLWQHLESTVKTITQHYGYQEIRLPIVESTDLFKRSIGEVTDIVEKEMYTFADRNDDLLTLRPEGTAGCARAAIQHGLLHNQVQRLWYAGPMFRHERPQKGRYRQFYHIGIEAFGIESAELEAELIAMTAAYWRQLGIDKKVRLEINSLGSNQARMAYREELVAYFKQHFDLLDDDSKRRLESNPLRILDSKNPELKDIIAAAPVLLDHLDEESKVHFSQLRHFLDQAGIEFQVNPCLVRGLDYYNRTVFEWITEELGAQGTVCAGGRYDGLVEQLGGKSTPAAGFAIGVERVAALMESLEISTPQPDVFIIKVGEAANLQGFTVTESLRQACPDLTIINNIGGGSFKSQFKKADKSGAAIALIFGDDEIENNVVGIKYLRDKREQETIEQAHLSAFLTEYFS